LPIIYSSIRAQQRQKVPIGFANERKLFARAKKKDEFFSAQ